MKGTSFLLFLVACLPSVQGFSIGHSPPVTTKTTTTTTTTTALRMSSSSDRSPNPIIKVAASGMGLLKPLFQAEAIVQAKVLGAISNVDTESVTAEIDQNKSQNKVLIYTYRLSPFSTEALALLDASGYDYTTIELGLEWFLLGGRESQIRLALGQEVDNGATSLPKIFIGGNCIGGCSELATLIENEELDGLMKQARVMKRKKK